MFVSPPALVIIDIFMGYWPGEIRIATVPG
jgi:hypothetical protein